METSRLLMPLLTELGGLGDRFCYKQVAPNGAPAVQRWLFNKAIWVLINKWDQSLGAADVGAVIVAQGFEQHALFNLNPPEKRAQDRQGYK